MGYSEAEYEQAQENMQIAWEEIRKAFLDTIQPLLDWWENLPPEIKRMLQQPGGGPYYTYLMRLKYQRDTIPFIKRGCKL